MLSRIDSIDGEYCLTTELAGKERSGMRRHLPALWTEDGTRPLIDPDAWAKARDGDRYVPPELRVRRLPEPTVKRILAVEREPVEALPEPVEPCLIGPRIFTQTEPVVYEVEEYVGAPQKSVAKRKGKTHLYHSYATVECDQYSGCPTEVQCYSHGAWRGMPLDLPPVPPAPVIPPTRVLDRAARCFVTGGGMKLGPMARPQAEKLCAELKVSGHQVEVEEEDPVKAHAAVNTHRTAPPARTGPPLKPRAWEIVDGNEVQLAGPFSDEALANTNAAAMLRKWPDCNATVRLIG
jgi:hypothetical protein